MAPPPPHVWADAAPYHLKGTQQQEAAPEADDGSGAGTEDGFKPRSLWIGALLDWMDESYLRACFSRSPELVSVVVKRNKHTGKSEGYGFLNFSDHATADQIRQSYDGQKMPNADRVFKLNWVTYADSGKRAEDDDSDQAIYVGGLPFDVTDYMLHHVFKSRYPSVKDAKVIWDSAAGHSKGYGFVLFGDVNEQRQAMTEMNGAYCSTRPMRIGPAANKNVFGTLGRTDSDCNPSNSRLFVGNLDSNVTDEDLKEAFSPYGELVNFKIVRGKNCGFVAYSSRTSAVEAIRMLNGSQLGDNTIRVLWARRLVNKQDQSQNSSPGYGWCSQDPNMQGYTGHSGQQQPQQSSVQ